MSRPGVLLDRDGVINVDHGYVGSVERVELIPGAAQAIAALNRAALPVAVVSNQSGVAHGRYTIEDVEQVHGHLARELARHGAHVDHWLYCPYHPDGVVPGFTRPSADRKPGPGLALAAAELLDLDLTRSWVVGDRATDMGLARAVGARGLFVGRGDPPWPDTPRLPDLAAAVDVILDPRGSAPEAVRRRAQGPPAVPPGTLAAFRYLDAGDYGVAYADELRRALATVDRGSLARAARLLHRAFEDDAAVYVCGNGGSAAIANHLQCDHLKGVRERTGLSPRVYSLSSNVELFSAIANDHGYSSVFEYQLQSLARPGDVLVVISSSGRSPNVLRAMARAERLGVPVIGLTGFDGGGVRPAATVAIHVDAANYGIVEDAHQACMHLLAQHIGEPPGLPAEAFTAPVSWRSDGQAAARMTRVVER